MKTEFASVHTMNFRRIVMPIIAMGVVVLISNVLVQYPLGAWLTWGALTYPFAFLITDIVTRNYGLTEAKKVIGVGALVGICASGIAALFALTTLRIAIASATAFLMAQITDAKVFHALRALPWWQTPVISSVIGSVLDTFLFFSIAFSALSLAVMPDGNTWALELVPLLGVGPMLPLWVSLAVADLGIKLILIPVMLVLYRTLGSITANRGR